MAVLLLIVVWIVIVLVSMLVSSERKETATRPAIPGTGDSGPFETRWTAWDDHMVARLLEETPPS